MAEDDQPTDELTAQDGSSAPAGLAEPPLMASGRRLGGRYVLERVLGHGGMAVVWLATDERLDRPVAVKVLSDTLTSEHDYRGRFRREAQVAAGLQHPNLVPVYDYDAGERPYLVMEYVEGGDLAAAMTTGTAPPAEQVGRELLAALRHIHGAGILHRDIKPHNVLIDGYGHTRLTDFGIARPSNATQLTKTGHVIGTETYLAPEVKAGEPASERSDLYALGVLLAELGGEGRVLLLGERLRDPDPDQRPASAAAALAELERTAEATPTGVPTQVYEIEPAPEGPRPFEPTITRARSPQRRSRWLALAAVGLAVVAVAVALLAGGGGGDGDGINVREQGGGGKGSNDASAHSQSAQSSTTEDATASEPAAPADEEPSDDGAAAPAGDDGYALNGQGFEMIGQGDYAGAVPVLEKAVDLLRDSGDTQTYNYALYNLATAYLGAGDAEAAIPLLEERMKYDDGQLDEVQAKLDEAYAAAGVEPSAEGAPEEAETPPDDEKAGKGPKDKVPPGLEEKE